MIRSTLTDRGQTTIPAEVRQALKLKPRQGLIYELQGGSVVVRPEGETLMDLDGCLGAPGTVPPSAEEAAAAIAAYVLEQNPPPGDAKWSSP